MTAALHSQAKAPAPQSIQIHSSLSGLESRLARAGGLEEYVAMQRKPLSVQPPLVQAKLKIGPPDDEYEREADRVAEQVMSMPQPRMQRKGEEEEELQTKPLAAQITPLVQRQTELEEEEEEKIQSKRLDGLIQRQEQAKEEETHILQRKCARVASQEDAVSASLDRVLAGSGSPLDTTLQRDMGQRIGYDFSQVRVYSGRAAEQSARKINANAYTLGHDIVFGAGRFAPGTHEGRRLIAHELTHVVQQSGAKRTGAGEINEKPALSQASSQLIRADRPDAGPSDAQQPGGSGSTQTSPGEDKCNLIIMSELPKNESAGHAFLRIENPSDSSKNITRGLWPACAQCTSSGLCSFLETQRIVWAKGPGKVCDDRDEVADHSISYDLNASQCASIRRFIKGSEASPPSYGAMLYNCVDFVLDAARAAGIMIPRQFFSGISEPADLAVFIERQKGRMEGKSLIDSGKLVVTQSPAGNIDLNFGAEFNMIPKPQRFDALEYRWIIEDDQGRRHLMIGPGGSVFQFGAHPSAQIGPKTRASLKKLGIKNAKVLCRVRSYYNNDLQHNESNSDEKLLSLQITFI